jgi:hypothetical protein
MKRSIQFLFFLMLSTVAVAQEDFYNQYLITMSGTMAPHNDPNGGCGSGFFFNVIFEDGTQAGLVSTVTVGGRGAHPVNGSLVFSSRNKVRSLYVWARNENDSWDGCEGSNFSGVLPFTPTYPCHDQNHLFQTGDVAYDFYVNVKIQPLSNKSAKVSFEADLRNNANEDFANDPALTECPYPSGFCAIIGPPTSSCFLDVHKYAFRYALTSSFNDGSSQAIFSGAAEPFDRFSARDGFSRRREIIYPSMKMLSNLALTADGNVRILVEGYNFRGFLTTCAVVQRVGHSENNFPITDQTVPFIATRDFALYPGAAPSQIRVAATAPYTIPIKYGPDASNILPYDTANRITILGPAGNAASFYHWVYSSDGVTWTDLPEKFQARHRLTISGYELQGEEFLKHHNTNVFFKLIIDCNGGESDVLTLSRRISAPNMVNVIPMPDRCFDKDRDGAFKITFERPLFVHESGARETLTILVRDLSNTNPPDQILDVTLDADNSLTWPRRLQSDRQYEISLFDTYLGAPTYTGNKINHYDTIELVRPSPVSSVIVSEAVHCYGGADGKINLFARGGAGEYRFEYVRSGAEDTTRVSFGTDTTAVISFLPQGTYHVHVHDRNHCGDGGGVKSIIVNQPPSAVSVAYSATTDPRAYEYTDGYIETILAGGTPYPDKHYTVEWYDPAALLPDSLQNNAVLSEGYQANIDSLGDGSYILKAYDSQYEAAHPDHRAGCYAESEVFRLVQPPPLIVTVSERHYVSCNGFDDGKLSASAQGGIPISGTLPYRYEWLAFENGTTRPIGQTDSIARQLKSGVYIIKITDKNNIDKLSDPFTLVQPDILHAQVTGTPVSCSSGADGTAQSLVQGGTLPYAYEWSEGSTTQQVTALFEGTYFVFVTDVRGCTTTASGNVASPYPLQIDSVLRAPRCAGYTNGGIDITVTAGTAPYRYEWNTGAVTEDIDGLTEGSYSVMIIDQNNCRSYRVYELTDPEPIQIELGNERYLCNDQSYEADASLPDPGAQYQWTGPGGFTAATGKIVLTREGTYHVNATDSQGCSGEDELTVSRVGADIGAEFIVTTQAFATAEVALLNISTPEPDSSRWWVANQAMNFMPEQDHKTTCVFPEEGVYTIYMRAYRQGCEAVFSKTVTVLGAAFEDAPLAKQAFIEVFTVTPNPARDAFTVTVALREESSIRLRLISVANNTVVNDRQQQGSSRYEVPYTTTLAAGTYLLLLESPNGNNLVKVIIY